MLNAKGFTFAEVLIAIAVFAIAVIGLAVMSGNAIRGLDSAKKLSAALNLAEAKLEALKLVSYSNLETNGSDGGITRAGCKDPGSISGCDAYTCTPSTDYPAVINNVSYSWFWETQIIDADGNGTCSSSGDGLKKIIMHVGWTDAFGSRTVQLSTMRAK